MKSSAFKATPMTGPKLAVLTVFALPIPVVAALFGIHCHGAQLTSQLAEPPGFEVNTNLAAEGQRLISLFISPAAIPGGSSSKGTVSLRYPAGPGGELVALKVNDSRGVSVPASVLVPAGKSTAHFPISTRAVSAHVAIQLWATCENATVENTLAVLPAEQRRWHVSPRGISTGAGTERSPWDLTTALAHGPGGSEVKPGDTIWLHAGRYTGTFVSKLSGRADAPIVVRAYPGERVIIDNAVVNEAKPPALKVKGPWVWFWGIEIMNSNTDRRRISPVSGRDEPWRGSGADVYAPNVKFINMIFHDNGHGIWDKKDMTEVHGCLFFYNGNNKREHALYIGNSTGTKYITDNIVFDQGGYGILAHSDSHSSSQKGVHIEGNISFNNGMLTADDQKTRNLQVGGVKGVSAERIVIKNNYIYNPLANANNKNNGIRLGYEDAANKDVKLLDNYIVSKNALLVWWWENVEFQGNTIYSNGESVELKVPAGVRASGYHWDFNSYFSGSQRQPLFANETGSFGFLRWRELTGLDRHSRSGGSSRPTGVHIFVRPNRYEAGRGNVVVYNWDLREQVLVDLSSVLSRGMRFEVLDAQNIFGAPVMRGVFKGDPVLLPLQLSNKPLPVGNVERVPRHTGPEFVVFVVRALPAGG
jgi:hypothetical protein